MMSAIFKFASVFLAAGMLASCITIEPSSQTASGPPDFTKSMVLYKGPVDHFAVSADASALVLASDGIVKMISMDDGSTSFTGHYAGAPLKGIGLHADEKTLVGGTGQSIYVWDSAHDQRKASRLNYTSLSHKSVGGPPSDFAMSPDGRYAATASRADFGAARLVLWDIQKRAYKHSFTMISESTRGLKSYGANAVAFSPDSKKMAVALTPENIIQVLRVADGRVLQHINLAPGTVRISSMAFSPDGKYIAAVGVGQNSPRNYYPQPIQMWYLSNGAEHQAFKSRSFTDALAFTPSGRYLASGSNHGLIRLWDTKTGARLQTLEGPRGRVSDLAFIDGGRTLVSSSRSPYGTGSVRLWTQTNQ